MEDVVLKDTNIDPTQEDVMMAFLVDKVDVKFSQAYHRLMILSVYYEWLIYKSRSNGPSL